LQFHFLARSWMDLSLVGNLKVTENMHQAVVSEQNLTAGFS
jgi:hypothetical protein